MHEDMVKLQDDTANARGYGEGRRKRVIESESECVGESLIRLAND